MDIVNGAEAGDTVLEKNGLKIFMQQEVNHLFPDATIDFSDEQGFMIGGIDQCSCS
jgi:Fe-S cluster assembly iron-binding protein IscA